MNLYMSDLDGTLLNSDAVLSTYTINNLNSLLDTTDINFSIATARTPATVVPLLKDLHLKLPLVVMNGAATYSLKEARYTHYNAIDSSSVTEIMNILKRENLSFFTYTLKNEHINVYFENEPSIPQQKFMDERKGSPLKSFIKGAIPEASEILYFFIMENKDKILSVFDEINAVSKIAAYAYEDIYDRSSYILEIFSEKSSKANAIKDLKKQYHFTNLTVFGDNFNDIPMFELAENKIAVKNAVQKLKEMSTKVISSNNDNGVVSYLLEEFKK
ncbi:HAD-IIB family hydrolase [uncultured Clostridium sp.]|uniref:HAD-IIB family hydrolase n=1 Tax=uncultured Clostridium sp. TaxID=59620 RepID=UPI002632CDFF|nr:HAD-IIB family hydrolase [uncultured Clostridium sp.]